MATYYYAVQFFKGTDASNSNNYISSTSPISTNNQRITLEAIQNAASSSMPSGYTWNNSATPVAKGNCTIYLNYVTITNSGYNNCAVIAFFVKQNSTPTTYTTHSVRISSTGVTANIWYYDKNNNYQTATLLAGGTLAFNARSGINYAGATNISYVNGYTTPITWNYNDSSGNNRLTEISNGGNNSIDTTYDRGIQINATKLASTTYTVYVQKDSHTGYASVSYGSTSSENYVSGVPYNGKVTFTATNFSTGYEFSHWADTNGTPRSTDNPWKPNIQADFTAKAISKPISTNTVEVYASMITPNAGYAYVNGDTHKTITKGSSATWTCDLNAGYTFNHWAPTSGPLPTNAYNPRCTVDNILLDLTLLCYTNYVGTVICKAVAGTGIKHAYVNEAASATVTKGNTVSYTCTVDTDNGYSFDGWYTSNGQIYSSNQSFDVEANTNLTLYAKGIKNTVEVYANMITPNAGYAYVNGDTHKTITKGSSATWTYDLNAGYTFDHWAPTSGPLPTNAYNPSCTVDNIQSDLTLLCYTNYVGTVICKAVASTGVKYAYVNEAASVTVTKNTKVHYTCTVDTNNGYHFDGWYTSNGQIYSSNQSFDVEANTNLTLYAKGSKEESVTVTALLFDDGSLWAKVNNTATTKITKGSSATWTCELKAGYIFDYWAPSSGDQPPNAHDQTCLVQNILLDLTLWCHTKYVGTITCKATAGEGISSAKVNNEDSVILNKGSTATWTCSVKTSEGYNFIGWFNGNIRVSQSLSYTPPGGINTDLTLEARAAKNITYILSFDANGGLGAPNSLTYTGTDSSHTFTIPNTTPSYLLHKFLGWHTDKTSTIAIYGGDTGNNTIVLQATNPTIKLYAIWKEYKYFTWTASDADDAVQIKQGKPFCITSQKWNDFNNLIKNLKSNYKPTPVLPEWQFSHIYMRETLTVLQGLTNDPFPGFPDGKDKDTINKNDPVKAIYFTELKTYLNNKLKNP